MRIESSVTSLSWIPLGATEGFNRLTFGLLRIAHFDPPPPDMLGDLDELAASDRFRMINRLEGWIEVQDGRIVDAGQGGGRINVTKVGYGQASIATWWREAYGAHSPWGKEDSAPIVTAVESALQRQLSVAVIDAKPKFLRLKAGRTLVQQASRATTCSCCSTGPAGRGRRQAGGRGRPRGDPRGDGPAAPGPAHRHPPGGDPLPGGRGPQGPHRPSGPRGAGREPRAPHRPPETGGDCQEPHPSGRVSPLRSLVQLLE